MTDPVATRDCRRLPFVDLDTSIEEQAGVSIPELFRRDREEAFRELESRLLLELGERRCVVIATGGGAPMRVADRAFLLASCRTFYLEIGAAEVVRRVGGTTGRRCSPTRRGGSRNCWRRARRPLRAGWGHARSGRMPATATHASNSLVPTPARNAKPGTKVNGIRSVRF